MAPCLSWCGGERGDAGSLLSEKQILRIRLAKGRYCQAWNVDARFGLALVDPFDGA
jgi:hypothetical protein